MKLINLEQLSFETEQIRCTSAEVPYQIGGDFELIPFPLGVV